MTSTIRVPLRGSGTSTIPLMAFLGDVPRHLPMMELDIGLKANVPSRIIVATTEDANIRLGNVLKEEGIDVLLRFQPRPDWSEGLWVGPVMEKNAYLEVKLPAYGPVDLCDAFLYIVAEDDEEKVGTLRLTISEKKGGENEKVIEVKVGRPAGKRGRTV